MTIATLDDYLQWAEQSFLASNLHYGHGSDNPWDEAVLLAIHVLSLPPDVDASVLDQKLSDQEIKQLTELTERRIKEQIPVPYLTNEAWFAGEKYYVDQNVLIPRSPLAELVSNHFQPWLGTTQPKRILDLCTGSGCIAIYCAKEFPDCEVDAVDISKEALAVAHKNIKLHHSKVNAIESDLFATLQGRKYDIIVSNPPYVGKEEMESLPAEYRHEPTLALASGNDGLDLTTQILEQAKEYLTPKGLLVVEVGNSWEALADKYPEKPFVWLEFQNGGDGVFLLGADEL